MKDEIKVLENILFRLHCDSPISKKYGIELDKNECKLLLDYITNLQESEAYYYGQYKDYKSRNEKAIELLKEAGCYDEETKTFCDDIWEELPKLLNILNGDKDE